MKEEIAKILEETDGELKYCEQMVDILCVCGFSPAEADTIRKDYGKKIAERISKWEEAILDKCGQTLGSELIKSFRERSGALYKKNPTGSAEKM